jgi:WD40 repeat protein
MQNSICFSKEGDLVCVGGDDTTVRFFRLGEGEAQLVHSYSNHSHPIKNVDHNQADLYLSTDNHRITVCNLPKKQIVRTVYQDQLLPEKSLFQSA